MPNVIAQKPEKHGIYRSSYGYLVKSVDKYEVTTLFYSLPSTILSQDKNESEFRDLSTLFQPGYILQDRNGDSVIDFVNARIIIPENPRESHIVCAANIAARLAYETSGINLDLVQTASVHQTYYAFPIISINTYNKNLSGLSPGQGRITFHKSDAFHEGGVISTGGADESGLITAANYFAGRYPVFYKL